MAKRGRKNKADVNKQLFDKANSYSLTIMILQYVIC